MKIRHWIEFSAFQLIAFFVKLLPLSAARGLGRSLGRFVFSVLGYRKNVTLSNLRRAFPEKSSEDIERIARGAYENAGTSLFELVWFPRMSREEIQRQVRFDKPEILIEAHGRGKGVLVLTAHFGNWELLGQAIWATFGFPFSGIAKTQSNRLIDRSINERRKRLGVKVIPMETSLREVLRVLRDGELVAIVADQAAPKENVPVEFFGTMVPTHQGPSAFSLKTGAAIVAMFAVRASDGTYDVRVIDVPSAGLSADSEADVVELTQRHVKITEEVIRQFPDHWLWMHKRWKHMPLPGAQTGGAAT